ncbi:p21-activated protein kinase-interacting protein 1-like protein [Modicella reniformis]|uniref:P21-activated protein kinase-interacting protein 1-like protein n=1 Tax=Modicella reniformis TaxID=1440133 RepID=A0A9P6MLT8_9FUNG|nr:p21-activated protein kinase-interacting protein 1-like protein [Modicella reniformis]
MDKNKKPLKSALTKATAAPIAAAKPLKSALKKKAPTSTVKTASTTKRKHTTTTNQTNKRPKTESSSSSSSSKNNNSKKPTGGSKANRAASKRVTTYAPPQTKKNIPSTQVKQTVVNKSKKIPVVPEGATLEDFRIVAGTYENILYGLDAYWNEDMTLRLSPIFIFAAHIGCIKSLAIGGHFLASGSTDEKIQLYDLKRRKELGALLQHQGTITSLSFHSRTHMLSGSDDGKVCVWRSKDWECLKIMKGHQATVRSIAIHPSGKIALSVSADRSVRLWNLLLGKQASMTKLQSEGLKVAWNPSGTGYSIMFDQEIGIYDMITAKCIRTINPGKTRLNTMTYYQDNYLVVGNEDKMVRIYNTTTGDLVKTLVGHATRIKALDLVNVPFTPEEISNRDFVGRPETKMVDVLISVSSDGTILAWNLEDVVAPASSAETMNMRNHIGEHKTDMRVTCLSVRKGIWKNVGVETSTLDDGQVEDEDAENDEDNSNENKNDDEEDEEQDEEDDE